MSNHFHILVQLERPADLSKWLAGMLRAYVHYFNRRYRFVGHLLQGRFKSPAVQCEGYLLSCGRSIERNPVDAGLVTEPWQYVSSSCRAYASGAADPMLADNTYYLELGHEGASRQRRWREFLMGEDPKEQAFLRADWVVGDETFQKRLQVHQGRAVQRRRGRPPKSGGETAGISS
jgi:putative transposase